MKKRQIAFALVIAMLTSGMLGCAQTDTGDVPSGTGTSSDAVAVETEEETEAPETTVLEGLAREDYGGTEFQILGEQMRDYYTFEELTGDVINDAVYERNASVGDLYNIDLTFDIVPWQSGDEAIQQMTMSGDKTYDLLTSTHLYLGSCITSGCFQSWNITDRIKLDSPWYVSAANETYGIGDNLMLLFGDFLESTIRCTWCMIFNQQLLTDFGMPNLYDVVDEGKWTIDYLMEVTNDVYIDVDGNGRRMILDRYGFVTDSYAAIDSFGRTCGLSAISKDENNYPVLDFYSESTVDAYEKLYQLYYESTGTFVNNAAFAHLSESFVKGNAVISNTLLISLEDAAVREMESDFGILPYPKLTEEQEMGYSHLDGTFSAMMLSVNLTAEDIDKVATVTEALNALGYDKVRPALYEVALKTKLTRDEDSVRMLDRILEGRRFSFDSLDESNFMLSPNRAMRGLLSQKNKDIASYYAANEAGCIAWIENIIEAYEKSLP